MLVKLETTDKHTFYVNPDHIVSIFPSRDNLGCWVLGLSDCDEITIDADHLAFLLEKQDKEKKGDMWLAAIAAMLATKGNF